MSSIESLLLAGLAAILDTANLGVWNADGSAYAPTDVGICLMVQPSAPNNIITLSTYGVSDDPSLSDSVIGVQVRTRRAGQDPRPVMDLDGAVFDLLHGMPSATLPGGVRVVSCFRHNGPVSMGLDTNNRWSLASNYYLQAHRPSTNRT